MKKLLVSAAVLAGVVCQAQAAELNTDDKRFSYIIGYQIAQQVKGEGVDIDKAAFWQAFEDVKADKAPALSREESQATMQRMQEKKAEQAMAQGEENKKAGEKFLAENKGKPGVKTTESGLQYKVISAGTGKKPAATDTVEVHYRGTLINGTEFDSSYARGTPATFPVNGVIQGWQEALQLMNEGAKWEVYIPSDLAYDKRGAGALIGPNSTLIFTVELLKIKG